MNFNNKIKTIEPKTVFEEKKISFPYFNEDFKNKIEKKNEKENKIIETRNSIEINMQYENNSNKIPLDNINQQFSNKDFFLLENKNKGGIENINCENNLNILNKIKTLNNENIQNLNNNLPSNEKKIINFFINENKFYKINQENNQSHEKIEKIKNKKSKKFKIIKRKDSFKKLGENQKKFVFINCTNPESKKKSRTKNQENQVSFMFDWKLNCKKK
jgi:hypothetical protein